MRYFVVIFVLLLLAFSQAVLGQDADNPCQDMISSHLEVDLEPFDFVFSCESGFDCIDETYLACEFQLASKLLKVCEPDDLFCRNQALLKTAGVFISTKPYGYNWPEPGETEQILSENFSKVLSAFSAKDFEKALELLEDPALTDFQYPMVFYARGLTYEMLNKPTEAIESYRQVLEFVRHHILTHYTLGLLYGELGRDTEASFESAWVEDYLTAFAADLLPLVEPLTENYPLDATRITTWIKYPVMIYGVSPVRADYSDRTQITATPIRIGIYDELSGLLAIDVSELHYPRSSGDVLDTYIFQKLSDQHYQYVFASWGSNPDTITLEFRDGLIFAEEYLFSGENHSKAQFILAPADQPDPRQMFGEPACEGGVISRLKPGMSVFEMAYTPHFVYASTPGGIYDQHYNGDYGSDPTSNNVQLVQPTVTENSICIGDQLWWEVTDGQGNLGWRVENTGTDYQITPGQDLWEFFELTGEAPEDN